MKRNITSLFLVLSVLCIAEQSECYKILAAIVTPSYSHQIPYRPLWLELHKRGHEVLLITPNPIPNINSPNFTQIDISQSYKIFEELNFVEMRFSGDSWLQLGEKYATSACLAATENMFNNTEFKKMYAPDSDTRFDIILTEYLFAPAVVGLVHRFDVPIIGTSSTYSPYIFTVIWNRNSIRTVTDETSSKNKKKKKNKKMKNIDIWKCYDLVEKDRTIIVLVLKSSLTVLNSLFL